MLVQTEKFTKQQLKKNIPDARPGDTVKVYQKIKEKGKERIQVFEGLIIARKHGKGMSSTITVRKVISGVGVEKIFPLHSPFIDKIEITKRSKVRRAKLYYLREAKGKKTKLKRKEFASYIAPEEPEQLEPQTEENSEAKTESKPEDTVQVPALEKAEEK